MEEIFRCFICFNHLQDPLLTPCCQKLCCNSCIKRWLEQRKTCAHCRQPLKLKNLVNCKFLTDLQSSLQQQISILSQSSNQSAFTQKPKEICEEHETELQYYCNNCNLLICSDCAILTKKHQSHKVEKVQKLYQKHLQSVKEQMNMLAEKVKQIDQQIEEIDFNIEDVKKSKEERMQELVLSIQSIQNRIEQQYKEKLIQLMRQKASKQEQTQKIREFCQNIEQQMNGQNKMILIKESQNICKQIQNNDIQISPRMPITTSFINELIPNYESSEFKIQRFSEAQSDVIYSPPFNSNGLTWRLKVYPNGNGIAKSKYLSIFIELVKGINQPSKYEYRIQMVNFLNPNLTISKEYSSEFECGECWGYNRFYRLSQLNEGFLDQEDALSFKFSVRAPNFFQLSRDLQNYITQLESGKNNQSEQQISTDKSQQSSNGNIIEKDFQLYEQNEEGDKSFEVLTPQMENLSPRCVDSSEKDEFWENEINQNTQQESIRDYEQFVQGEQAYIEALNILLNNNTNN